MKTKKIIQLSEVSKFKTELQQMIPAEVVQAWLEQLKFSVEENILVVSGIPHPAFLYDIKKNYDTFFKTLAKNLWGVEQVKYQLQPKLKTPQLNFELPSLSPEKVEYPTDFCRISPFKPLKRGQQKDFVQKILFESSYGTIQYEGKVLGVDDEDVFMALLREGREQLFRGEEVVKVELGIRELLRKIGRSYSGQASKWLKESLQRLRLGTMIFKTKRFTFVGGFLNDGFFDEETGKLVIRINPTIGRMYLNNTYTLIDFQQHLQLKDTGKRLHAFLNSQRNLTDQFSFSAETAKAIMNSDAEIKEVRRKVKRDLGEMVKLGFLKDFSVDEDQYTVFFDRKKKA